MLPYWAIAQAIDNTLAYKHLPGNTYARLNYENDFFSATDQYYTQGIHLELVAPWVRRWPVSRILLHPRWGDTRFGMALEHNGYTPTSISSDNVLLGDRPFAATLSMKNFCITIDTIHKQRFSSSVYIGILGRAAGGGGMQRAIHHWLNNITPHGWEHQIANTPVVNYQIGYEKLLYGRLSFLQLSADAMARAGTLSTKLNLGGTVMAGYFASPYGSSRNGKKWGCYAYLHPLLSAVAYDATLQGAVLSDQSTYTLPANQMSRTTLQNRYGIAVSYRGLCAEYFRSTLSREFATGRRHAWGGVQLAYTW